MKPYPFNCIVLIFIVIKGGFTTDIISRGQWKVIGGVEAGEGEYPPMIFLSVDIGDGQVHGCGASILNEYYILSGAHCCAFQLSQYEVIAGVHNYSSSDENWQRRKVVEQLIHPEYVSEGSMYIYDICVLRLNEPFNLTSSRVGVATLTPEFVPVGQVVTFYGWGRRSYLDPRSPVLYKANSSILSFEECNEEWGRVLNDRAMLCTTTINTSPCHGDSVQHVTFLADAEWNNLFKQLISFDWEQYITNTKYDTLNPEFNCGPLVWNDARDGPKLIGIVSWGSDYCEFNYPAVYGDVSKNLEWILKAASMK